MATVTIQGFYGMNNLGDDILLKSLVQNIKAKHFVLTMKPKNINEDVIPIYPKYFGNIKARNAIKKSDLFILGGGGLIKDYGNNSKSLEYWLKYIEYASKRINTSTYGVGVRNIKFNKSKKRIRNVLNNVDLVTVRDKESKEILEDIGVDSVDVVGDLALLLDVKRKKIQENNNILISVRHWFERGFYTEDKTKFNDFLNIISETIDYLIEQHNKQIDFVPFRTTSYDDDRKVIYEIIERMNYKSKASILSRPSVDDIFEIIQNYSLVIGMRLHSLIIASLFSIPIIGLEYAPKVTSYMDMIGQSDYSFNLSEINEEKLKEAVDLTLNNTEKRSNHIYRNVYNLKNKSCNEFKKLRGFL